ncbi:hypothetical protein EDC96DRAFT_504838 [Choanephora cucurbitarum]|nr:hypothetical protein EDC96DRAFT_504838 [Choanephora cucurbitarum]
MTSNIFVAQTFNGEKMVNASSRKSTVISEEQMPIQKSTEQTLVPLAPAPPPPQQPVPIAPVIAPAPPPPPQPISIASSPAQLDRPESIQPPSPSKENNKGYQGRVHDIAVNRPKRAHPFPFTNNNPPALPQQTIVRLPYPPSTPRPTYWSEADTAILIQLHRKYYPAIQEDTLDKENGAWSRLTTEFNMITQEQHSMLDLHHRWVQLMAKYNAERAHLMLQHRQASLQPQPFHVPSYWSHFQYMDLYLHHLPVPEDALYYQTQSSTPQKRPRLHEQDVELTQQLFETHRTSMQEQANQMKLMKQHYESIFKMNDKYMQLCERLFHQSQASEDRYRVLFDKIIEKQ